MTSILYLRKDTITLIIACKKEDRILKNSRKKGGNVEYILEENPLLMTFILIAVSIFLISDGKGKFIVNDNIGLTVNDFDYYFSFR